MAAELETEATEVDKHDTNEAPLLRWAEVGLSYAVLRDVRCCKGRGNA